MKILVAADDLEMGQGMIALLKNTVSETDADIKVVTVIPSVLAYTSLAMIPELVKDLRDSTRKEALSLVDQLAASLRDLFPQSKVEADVMEGTPAHEVVASAQQWQADLIVAGSHNKKLVKKIMLGSVSQEIVSHAPCSVLIYRKAVRQKEKTPASTLVEKRAMSKISTRM